MDEFVRNKLTEWGLSKWIQNFYDGEVDTESLYCLTDEEINDLIPKPGPRAKFKRRLKSLEEQEEAADSAQVGPSTSGTSDKGKRKLDLQDESSKCQSPATKRPCDKKQGSYSGKILSDVKDKIKQVRAKLKNEENTKLNAFLKNIIKDLEMDKRELVGVFGKTGAGKSSLINAVIGVNLLPSGSVSACTSVIIKVEANMHNSKYEAHIEFVTKEDWKDELWSYHNLGDADREEEEEDDGDSDDGDDDSNHDGCDTEEKLSALYGKEWKNISPENLMDNKYFREIQEFLDSKRKILACEKAEELSEELIKYTRSDSEVGEGEDTKRWYWPLVKCVTVRVPNNDLLEHVTLVDLPGNGDCNKSRDKMWKEIVGSCSTVWIVTDVNRAAAEKEPWEILQSASSLMGNGGECRQIHFICTKSDIIGVLRDNSTVVRDRILKRNEEAKKKVMTKFKQQSKIKTQCGDECFKVFTVSSKELLNRQYLSPNDTEIPNLKKFLQRLNDCHSETFNYVSGAYRILSLIQRGRCREVAEQKNDVCTALEENMRKELDKVRNAVEEAYKAFEKCLTEGVEKSKSSCEGNLKSILKPKGRKDRGFHRTLKCVVLNSGTYKPKKGRQININEKLSSCLTDSIDEEFRKTFPNEQKCGPFNGAINAFSLDTEKLIQKYKEVELQLTFLQTEEEKFKTKLKKIIRKRKKKMYKILITTIEEKMQECYKKAAKFSGPGTLGNMRNTIEKHVNDSKNTMFEEAKKALLVCLNNLKRDILEELEKSLKESIELSLKTHFSISDVSAELDMVKRYYDELKPRPDEELELIHPAQQLLH